MSEAPSPPINVRITPICHEIRKGQNHLLGYNIYSTLSYLIIGLPRWVFPTGQGTISLATEFCHYEGAVAYTLGLPMLVIVQEDVERRVVPSHPFLG